MTRDRVSRGVMVFIAGFMAVAAALAAGDHEGGHGHAEQHGGHSGAGEGMHHSHDEWVDPPAAYAGLESHKWADLEAIARGKAIYVQNCVSCHGANGQGTGPLAAALKHPPADLTNNFHTEPGTGDAYLFWRVSEGGQVEPFRSQGSSMPAFKDVLTPEQRWDVLAYVHTFFHQGLMQWTGSAKSNETRAQSTSTKDDDS